MANFFAQVLLYGRGAGRLGWDTKTALAVDIARGMAYMHGLGHIHRDLKSGNVLITETMQAKVADFGSVGRLLSDRREERAMCCDSTGPAPDNVKDMCQTQGIGTPLYM